MGTEITVEGLIQKAYESLKASDAESALGALKEALKLDFEHPEVVYALKCIHWWLERIGGREENQDPYEKGGYILSQWKGFYNFLDRIGKGFDSCHYALRRFVFSKALKCFEDVLGDGVNQHDPLLLLQVGRCYKGVGNYEQALKYLEQAVRFKRDDGATLAELADVNALLGDLRAAKALFREAFFLDPQGISLYSLEAELITRLREKLREQGYGAGEIQEWIPIYGCLWGIFSVKRELKQIELARIKQDIRSLENEFRGKGHEDPRLKPRLINRYFWLIDHYENSRTDPELIAETMLKIKIIDSEIYELYRA